jgi:ABC-type Fe3+ transport system substrate-binding protein
LVGLYAPTAAAAFLVAGEVDVFLTYASNAAGTGAEFDVVHPPTAMVVTATYGLIALATAPEAIESANAIVQFIGSASGQTIFKDNGYVAITAEPAAALAVDLA